MPQPQLPLPPPAARPAIRVLPPEVAARIAAGEVIERPASVLKELVENALDAGATRVEVAIEGGGIERLRVRDDGWGIPAEQLADACERHATSKLRSEHDLFAVRTLGFRGEALAAIVAAAEVEIVSRPPEQPVAAVARYRDGRPAGRGSAAAAPGTSVEVRELFAALPARRRFLRAPAAEQRAIVRALTELAVARPDVAFRLEAEGRALLATPGGGALADAVAALFGERVAAALLAVAGERTGSEGARAEAENGADTGADTERARVSVGGAVAAPQLHRANRQGLVLVANGRVVRPGALGLAIERAYEGLLPAGRHPLAFVRLTVPPEQIDVNVHPAKAEVRFRHERLVLAALQSAVRTALLGAPAAPLPAPPSWRGEPAERAGETAPGTGRALLASARTASALAPNGASAARDAGGVGAALPLRERLPALRALGQIDLTYLAAEAPDGLYLVDQHAAHERVLYERVRAGDEAGAAAGARSQPLLATVLAPLTPSQRALAAELAAELAALGWELDPTDGPALLVRALPALLAGRDPAAALADYLDRLEAEERLTGPERAAATLACRAAVRAGDRLEAPQQRALLQALERTAAPLTCPHGRPTVLHLGREAIARSFGRR